MSGEWGRGQTIGLCVWQEVPGGKRDSAGRTLRERLKLWWEQASSTQRPAAPTLSVMFTEKHSELRVCGVPVHRQDTWSDLYYQCFCPSSLHEHMEVNKFMFTCSKKKKKGTVTLQLKHAMTRKCLTTLHVSMWINYHKIDTRIWGRQNVTMIGNICHERRQEFSFGGWGLGWTWLAEWCICKIKDLNVVRSGRSSGRDYWMSDRHQNKIRVLRAATYRANNLWGTLSNDLIYAEITFNASQRE